jgi:hypothetical protein
MPEVQKHGFTLQDDMLRNVYGATDAELTSIGYTSAMDLPAKFNHIDGVNLSIKATSSANTVCMGDCLRIFDETHSETPFHMTVIQHKQVGSKKVIVKLTEVNLTNSGALLFGTVTRAEIQGLDRLVKTVPQKRKPTPEERKQMYALRDRLKKTSGAILFNIKCNSTQSRLQCSFNKFKKFIEENPSRIIAESTTATFRGGAILQEIESGPRVFKKKKRESD